MWKGVLVDGWILGWMNERDGCRVLTQHRWPAVGCGVEWQQGRQWEEERQEGKQKLNVKNETDMPSGVLPPW